MTNTTVILPTYQEAQTAPAVVQQVADELAPTSILVMDDSPDTATVTAIERDCGHLPVTVVCRDAAPDLSQAILEGLARADAERYLVMDADGQHPPSAAPEVCAALNHADVAIGTRHDGGTITADWSWRRYLLSFGASVLAWAAIPGVRAVQDPMSGFFSVRAPVVDAVHNRLDPTGFKILLEILAKAPVDHVAEVPVEFRARTAGASSLTRAEVVHYLQHIGQLAIQARRPRRPSRTVVGGDP